MGGSFKAKSWQGLLRAVGIFGLSTALTSAAVGAEPVAGSVVQSARLSLAAERLLKQATERYNHGVETEDPQLLKRALFALEIAETLEPRPSLLLNRAQVERVLGHCHRARDLFEQYLIERPNGAGRERAEHHLSVLGVCSDSEPEPMDALPPAAERALAPEYTFSPPVPLRQKVPGFVYVPAKAFPANHAASLRSTAPWLMSGAAGASVAAAGVFLWRAQQAEQDKRSTLNTAVALVADEAASDHRSSAAVFLGIGGGFALGASLLVIFEKFSDNRSSSPPALSYGSASALVFPGGVGLRGSF